MSLFQRIKNVFTGQSTQEEKVEREEAVLAEEEAVEEEQPTETWEETFQQEEQTERFVSTSAEEKEDIQEEVEEVKRFDRGLDKSSKSLKRRLNELLANFRYVDEEFFEDIENMLIESDVGFEATLEISDILREEARIENVRTMEDAEELIVKTLVDIYENTIPPYEGIRLNEEGLSVLLFVGVNGVGKTTTIAKLAHQYIEEGKKVVLAAGDTFRAGAIEQLHVWGDRVGADVVSSEIGGDPAAVVFDGIKQAKETGADILMVDTAGRLQNKKNLMLELEKMHRVIQKELPDAPQEVLLVLDATTGQNALIQAKEFKETTDVTGIVLTKMDGTAKGGIVIAIGKELGLPVKFVGFGEKMEDLRPFDADNFAYGLFSDLIEETV